METWHVKGRLAIAAVVIAVLSLSPVPSQADSGRSNIPVIQVQAAQQRPAIQKPRSAQQPGGPVSRAARYTVKFINNGPAEITLDHVHDGCMYDAGPRSIYVPSYDSNTIELEDKNKVGIFGHNCWDKEKWVQWSVHAVTEKGNMSPYDLYFRHGLGCGGVWCTKISGPDGQSSGNGQVTEAKCYYVAVIPEDCLNEWSWDETFFLPAPNYIEIYFDGDFSGKKQPAVITWPVNHSAIHGDDPSYVGISGTASADTQVNVSAKGHTESPWADDGGNWTTNAVYHFETGQVFSATVDSDVEGSATSTFISVPPVTINGPSSPVAWSDTITVAGTALPGATVVVRSDPQDPDSPACAGGANGSGDWSCGLEGLAPGADYNLVAWQQGWVTDDGLPWDWLDPVQAQWPLHVNAIPLQITQPSNGGHIDGDAFFYWAIFGTGTPGGQVTIDTPYSITRPVHANIDQNGNWQTGLVFSFPPTQTYTVPASQQVNGAAAPGASVTFESWPALKVDSPQSGATLPSTTTSLVVNGTGVPGGVVYTNGVDPDNGATICPSAPIAPDGSWSCAMNNLTPASYGALVQQQKSGQSDTSVPVLFSVAQPVSIDQPVPGQSYPAQTTQVMFNGHGQRGASLKVDVPHATPCQVQVIDVSGAWSCLVSGLKPGASYTATVTEGSSDAINGGSGWIDPAVTRQFSIDGFGLLSIVAPTENQVFPSATTRITASGVAQPNALLTVNVPNAQPCDPQTVGPAPGNWQCLVSGLQPNSRYLLTATQTVGGVDDVPKHVDFMVATPLAVLLPRENQVLAATDTTVAFSGLGQADASISVTADPAHPCNTKADDKGAWRCTVTGLTAGTSYTANVTQSGANWQDPPTPRPFSVAAAQGISIGSPRDKSVVSSNNPIDGIQVIGSGQSGAVAQVKVGSGTPQNVDIVNGAWASNPIPLTSYGAQGMPNLAIVATEYVDNNPNGSATVNITVAKVATVTSPKDQEKVQDVGKVTVSGQGQEGAKITVNVVDGNGPKKGCGATVVNGNWSCELSGILPNTTYTLSVLQSGQASDWTDQPVGRVFSTRQPRPVVWDSPSATKGMPASTPYDVSGTGEPGAQLSLKLMGLNDLGVTTVLGDGTWDFPNLMSSGPGCYSLTAIQTMNGYFLDQGTTQYPVGGATCPGGSPFYITLPMPDQVLIGGSYTVRGYGVPGAGVSLPGGPPCSAQVQPDGTWSCGPYPITEPGTYNVVAQQAPQPGDNNNGPTSTRRFSVLNPVALSAPADGTVMYWDRGQAPAPFSVSGTATPGILVEVSVIGGSGDTQYVTAAPDGTWTTAAVFLPPSPYDPGANCGIWGCMSVPGTLRARQLYQDEARDEATRTVYGEWFAGQGGQQRRER